MSGRDEEAIDYLQHMKNVRIRNNVWRPPTGLRGDNLTIDAKLGEGGFATVFRAAKDIPGLTPKYALKVWENLPDIDLGPDVPDDLGDGDSVPSIAASSEADITDDEEIKKRSLLTKRSQEIECHLRYIKKGHPNVCALEAYTQMEMDHTDPSEPDKVAVSAAFFELCDSGTLRDLIDVFQSRNQSIPEAFIWHVYRQLVSAVAFLHNEHPHYKDIDPITKKQRAVIVAIDIKADNVFLQSDPNGGYPTVKLGDLGEAEYFSPGGSRIGYINCCQCKPPEFEAAPRIVSAKMDVWAIGCVIYDLVHLGKSPRRPQPTSTRVYTPPDSPKVSDKEELDEGYDTDESLSPDPELPPPRPPLDWFTAAEIQAADKRRFLETPQYISDRLAATMKRALTLDWQQRPSSGTLLAEVESAVSASSLTEFHRNLPLWSIFTPEIYDPPIKLPNNKKWSKLKRKCRTHPQKWRSYK